MNHRNNSVTLLRSEREALKWIKLP